MLPDYLSPFLAESGLRVTNPATHECIATVAIQSAELIEDAICAADVAGRNWSARTAKEPKSPWWFHGSASK